VYQLVIILAALVLLWFLLVKALPEFQLTSIELIGRDLTLAVDETRLPKILLLISTSRLESELRQQYPLLAQIKVSKKYPHTLVITADTRTTLAVLSIENAYYLLDREGMVLGETDFPGSWPQIAVATREKPKLGMVLSDKKVQQSLRFLGLSKEIFTTVSVTDGDSLSLRAKTGETEILFPQDEDLTGKIATLQTLFSGFRIKGILPTRIDLRYNKPTVIF